MITAKSVKELREMTGAGMMDCKKALVQTEGDIEKAVEYLREKGLAAAAKKAGRVAAEGIGELHHGDCLTNLHILQCLHSASSSNHNTVRHRLIQCDPAVLHL